MGNRTLARFETQIVTEQGQCDALLQYTHWHSGGTKARDARSQPVDATDSCMIRRTKCTSSVADYDPFSSSRASFEPFAASVLALRSCILACSKDLLCTMWTIRPGSLTRGGGADEAEENETRKSKFPRISNYISLDYHQTGVRPPRPWGLFFVFLVLPPSSSSSPVLLTSVPPERSLGLVAQPLFRFLLIALSFFLLFYCANC